MAIFNEILSARFAKLSQKLFSMKGENAVKQLSGELMMVQQLPFGVEHRFLLSENRFGALASITGAAAQFCGFRLRNAAGSGVLAVIESLLLGSASSQLFSMDISGPVAADLATSVFAERLDGRLGSAINRSALSTSDQNTLIAPVTGSILTVNVPANGAAVQVISTENQELTVAPGDAFTIGNTTAASLFTVAILWRERGLEESELK